MLFLKLWLFAGAALGMAVVLLGLVYRLLDSNIGFEGIFKEAVVVVITSAIHALVFVTFLSLNPHIGNRFFRAVYIVVSIITYFAYKISHLKEMEDYEPAIITATNFACGIALWFGYLSVAE